MKLWTLGILCLMSYTPRASSWLYFAHQIDTQLYRAMPRLYEMDPFNSCPDVKGELEASAPRYCIVSVLIDHPKENADLFDFIHDVSEKKLHFKHDRLKRGVCVQTCLDFHAKNSDARDYLNDDASTSEAPDVVVGMMTAYNKIFNVCINKKLKDQHGFMARTSIDYCVGKNQLRTTDIKEVMIERAFAIVVAVIVFLLAASITYELFRQSPRGDAFSNRFKRTSRLLDVFSVKQNWKRLVGTESSDVSDFSSLHASKLLIMFFFVFAHVYRVIVAMPFENPEDVEKSYYNVFLQIFDLETVAHLFFIVSGVELSFALVPLIHTSSNNWDLLKSVVGMKYHQLVTLFSAFIFFNASFLHWIGSGPFWRGFTLAERNACRYNWRLGLLTFNNYAKPDEMCLEPTWILSVDLHMAVVGFVVLYLLVKFPRWKKLIIGGSISLSVLIVAYNILVEYLFPIPLVTPEVLRSGGDEDFHKVYYRSHMNAGSFLLGLIFAYPFYNKDTLKRFTTNAWTSFFAVFYAFVTIAVKYYFANNSPPFIWPRLLIGTYMKFHHGIFLGFFIVRFITEREIKMKFINARTLHAANKLFVPAFLSSLLVTRLIVQNSSKLHNVNIMNLFTLAIVIFALSYLLAIVVHLAVEMPFVRLKRGVKYEQIADGNEESTEAKKVDDKSEKEKKTE